MIGEQAYIAPDVKIYPFKTVESGAQINSSIIWESRGTAQLFGKDGVVGLINVDITAELGLKLAMAYGTTLPKGAKVVTSRDAHPASRVIKRAIISGLNSTGVDVRDLRVSSAAVNRFEIKGGNAQGGVHVRISSWDPEVDPDPGLRAARHPGQREDPEGHREVLRPPGLPARLLHRDGPHPLSRTGPSRPTCAASPSRGTPTLIRARGYRLVIDYSYSPVALVLPLVLPYLNAEVISLHAFTDEQKTTVAPTELGVNIADVQRLVKVMGADLGAVIDPGAERLYLVDELGQEIPLEKALLLFVRLVAAHAAARARRSPCRSP